MESKHTEGPWERRGLMVYGVDAGPGTAPFIGEARTVADAEMFAAAPDLLAACKVLTRKLEAAYIDLGMSRENPALVSARAAIARASA